jgi:putative peptidoglycan lipid II flippase
VRPDRAALRETLRQGLRLTMFIGLPASVGLILVRVPLSRVIYERGEFTLDDSLRVATILAGYASVIWAYSMTHVVTRAFYALKDARTPLLVSLAMMCVNLCLNLVLVWPLGAAGLAWSSAVCACGQVAMLLLAIRHYTGDPIGGEVWRAWGKIALLTAVMAGALTPFLMQSDAATSEWAGAMESLVVMLVIGVAVYAGGAWALDAKEMRWLLKRRVE